MVGDCLEQALPQVFTSLTFDQAMTPQLTSQQEQGGRKEQLANGSWCYSVIIPLTKLSGFARMKANHQGPALSLLTSPPSLPASVTSVWVQLPSLLPLLLQADVSSLP